MKKCPQCGRDYNDDSMSFCLDDGNELLFGPASSEEPKTAFLSESPPSWDGQSGSESATWPYVQTTDQTAVLPSGISEPPKARGFGKRLLLAPLALAVIALGGFFGYRYFTQAKQIESIAVMPFSNQSQDPDVEYLSDGMTESLIKSLSQLPDFAVKARSTVFAYKGKQISAKAIGDELGLMTAFSDMVVSFDALVVTDVGTEFQWTLTGAYVETGKKVQISGYELWQFGPDG